MNEPADADPKPPQNDDLDAGPLDSLAEQPPLKDDQPATPRGSPPQQRPIAGTPSPAPGPGNASPPTPPFPPGAGGAQTPLDPIPGNLDQVNQELIREEILAKSRVGIAWPAIAAWLVAGSVAFIAYGGCADRHAIVPSEPAGPNAEASASPAVGPSATVPAANNPSAPVRPAADLVPANAPGTPTPPAATPPNSNPGVSLPVTVVPITLTPPAQVPTVPPKAKEPLEPPYVGYVLFHNSLESIGALIAAYVIVALLIERFVMIFLLPGSLTERRIWQTEAANARKEEESLRSAASVQTRAALAAQSVWSAMPQAPASTLTPGAPSPASIAFAPAAAAAAAAVQTSGEAAKATVDVRNAEREADKELLKHSPQYAVHALVCGIVLAAFGFRFFVQIATLELPDGLDQDYERLANFAFYMSDVMLSGVLLAGGAQGIHAAIETIVARGR